MEEKKFFKTKAGLLTIGFIITMIAFVLIMVGVNSGNNALSTIGMVGIIVAMLLSPIKVFIIDKLNK